MSSEPVFRLISLLAFGCIVSACVAFQSHTIKPTAETVETVTVTPDSVDLEVDALNEVNEINSGRYQPWMVSTGTSASDQTH